MLLTARTSAKILMYMLIISIALTLFGSRHHLHLALVLCSKRPYNNSSWESSLPQVSRTNTVTDKRYVLRYRRTACFKGMLTTFSSKWKQLNVDRIITKIESVLGEGAPLSAALTKGAKLEMDYFAKTRREAWAQQVHKLSSVTLFVLPF